MLRKILIGFVGLVIITFIFLYVVTRPTRETDGAFSPSFLALKLATSPVTDFDNTIYDNPYTGNKKVLMVCTEERNMKMANGKMFSTGNHPVEMMLPMLHLKNAGFDIDIFTPTGKPVKIEMWAMPEEDEKVMSLYTEHTNQFENPKSLAKFVLDSMNNGTEYLAVYLPGGHGAMLGLPFNQDLNELIHWSYAKDMHMLAICHGPAALLAAGLNGNKNSYIYKGYNIAAFPDEVDEQTPMMGYMPGHMPWKFGEKLNELGITIINMEADKTVHADRKLITGAGPLAANNFGKLSATELLKVVNEH
ncbi:MAG: glyoxalase III HchA [Bacteroidota bacterium]